MTDWEWDVLVPNQQKLCWIFTVVGWSSDKGGDPFSLCWLNVTIFLRNKMNFLAQAYLKQTWKMRARICFAYCYRKRSGASVVFYPFASPLRKSFRFLILNPDILHDFSWDDVTHYRSKRWDTFCEKQNEFLGSSRLEASAKETTYKICFVYWFG